jgi:hypothetical protein
LKCGVRTLASDVLQELTMNNAKTTKTPETIDLNKLSTVTGGAAAWNQQQPAQAWQQWQNNSQNWGAAR